MEPPRKLLIRTKSQVSKKTLIFSLKIFQQLEKYFLRIILHLIKKIIITAVSYNHLDREKFSMLNYYQTIIVFVVLS